MTALITSLCNCPGEAAGVNDPGDIPWHTTAWSAGGVDVGSVKAGEGRKQPASAMSWKTVSLDLQGTAPSENAGVVGGVQGRVGMGEDNTVDMGVQLARE